LERYKRLTAKPEERMIFYDLVRDFRSTENTLGRYLHPRYSNGNQLASPYDVFSVKEPRPPLEILLTKLIATTYLLENGIVQGDRLGMASSVELRLPLLDYKFVETVIGLRKAQADDHLPPKTWLKDAAASRVPREFLDKAKKGFEPPVRRWHRALFERYGDTLKEGALVDSQVLSPKGAKELSQGTFDKFNIVPISFKALVLETWARQMGA
jgi:asparagine synthase (glutamine-hydrolysing)